MNLVVLFLVYIDVYVWRTRQLLPAWIQQPPSMTFPHLVNSSLRIERWRGGGLASHQWWFNHRLLFTFTRIIIEEDHWLHFRIRSYTLRLWCLSLFIRHYKERFQVVIIRATTSDVLSRSVAHWWYLFYVDALNQIWRRSHSKTVLNVSPLYTFVRSCSFLLK